MSYSRWWHILMALSRVHTSTNTLHLSRFGSSTCQIFTKSLFLPFPITVLFQSMDLYGSTKLSADANNHKSCCHQEKSWRKKNFLTSHGSWISRPELGLSHHPVNFTKNPVRKVFKTHFLKIHWIHERLVPFKFCQCKYIFLSPLDVNKNC